jgi:hypothetical protein
VQFHRLKEKIMKKSIMGFIALAMSMAFTTAALASIPDGDGISNGSPGLIASSTERSSLRQLLCWPSLHLQSLASVAMGTRAKVRNRWPA